MYGTIAAYSHVCLKIDYTLICLEYIYSALRSLTRKDTVNVRELLRKLTLINIELIIFDFEKLRYLCMRYKCQLERKLENRDYKCMWGFLQERGRDRHKYNQYREYRHIRQNTKTPS